MLGRLRHLLRAVENLRILGIEPTSEIYREIEGLSRGVLAGLKEGRK